MSKTEQVSFRLRKTIASQLRKIAQIEKRPLSNLINYILEHWIEDRDKKFARKYKEKQ